VRARRVLILLLLAALAGCLDDGEVTPDERAAHQERLQSGQSAGEEPAPQEEAPEGETRVGPAPPTTLHLVRSGVASPNASADSTTTPATTDILLGAGVSWTYTFQTEAVIENFTGDVWIEVPQPFVLFTAIALELVHADEGVVGYAYWFPPAGYGFVVDQGTHQLKFKGEPYGSTRDFEQGDELRIEVRTSPFYVGLPPPFSVLYNPGQPSQVTLEYGASRPGSGDG
jgi:hypothetical protein